MTGDFEARTAHDPEDVAGGIALPFGGNRMPVLVHEKGSEAMRTSMKLKSVAAQIWQA